MRLASIAVAAAFALCLGSSVRAADAPSIKTLSIGVFPALRPLELIRAEHWLEDAGYAVAWHDFLQGIPPEVGSDGGGLDRFRRGRHVGH